MVTQTDFRAALLDAHTAVPKGLVNPDGTTSTKRFDVYRNNVAVSLTDALETAFPAIRKMVGDDFFKAMAGVFLRQHPPTSPVLMFYGAEMPDFLAGFEPVQHLPYLPDLARLELAMRHAYHAADAAPMAPDALQNLPVDDLMTRRFHIAPAVRLLRSHYPIGSLWAMNMADGPEPQAGGENVLIVRPEFDPQQYVLAPGGGSFVAALMAGKSFGDALGKASELVPDFDLSQTLGVLLTGAAITKIEGEA